MLSELQATIYCIEATAVSSITIACVKEQHKSTDVVHAWLSDMRASWRIWSIAMGHPPSRWSRSFGMSSISASAGLILSQLQHRKSTYCSEYPVRILTGDHRPACRKLSETWAQ